MRLKLTTAPAIEPVTLDEARNHLKIDSSEDNSLISALITTARQLAEKETKRAFITQTWEMYLDEVGNEIEIPKPPLQDVTSIKAIAADGTETVVDVTTYYVDKAENSPGRVKLKSGYSWPTHRGFASFIIRLVCGYGDTATDVPEPLRQGILQLIAYLYENRGAEKVTTLYPPIPESIKAMFWPYKILKI